MSDAPNTAADDAAARRSRAQFFIILGLFTAPLIGAVLLAFYFPDLRPTGRTNKGVLVTPAQPITELNWSRLVAARSADDPSAAEFDIRGRWILLTVGGTSCDEACSKQLYNLRQIRTSTGRRRVRVHQIHALNSAGNLDTEFRQLVDEFHPDLTVARAPEALLQLLQRVAADHPQVAPRHYVIDPNGNLMMFYGDEHGNRDVLDDLMRLLKTSQIG